MRERHNDNPTPLTRKEISTSFWKMMPGIKILDYNEHDLIRDVCAYFKVSEVTIRDKKRTHKREIMTPRQVCIYLIVHMFPDLIYKDIGAMFGRDHATVTHTVKTVNELKFSDKHFCYQLKEVTELIESHILKKTEIPVEK